MTRRVVAMVLALAPAAAFAAGPAAKDTKRAKPDAQAEAKARAWFTDTTMVAQDGREVRFYSDVVRGRVVVVNFMFAKCPDACPLLTRKLAQVRRELGDAFGRDVRFVSISVDPHNDTPEKLAEFARNNGAEDPGWTFLTGTPDDVRLVIGKLGEFVENPAEHSTAFIAGNDRTRHWLKMRPDAPPAAIADALRRLAAE